VTTDSQQPAALPVLADESSASVVAVVTDRSDR
jgi:hypothetical protein